MKKFDVYIWQTLVRNYSATVEAENREEAKRILWAKIESGEEKGYEKYQDSDTSAYEVDI